MFEIQLIGKTGEIANIVFTDPADPKSVFKVTMPEISTHTFNQTRLAGICWLLEANYYIAQEPKRTLAWLRSNGWDAVSEEKDWLNGKGWPNEDKEQCDG